MEEYFQTKLSSGEILAIAALLGYESVFGIEDASFLDNGIETKRSIKQIVRRLERKKLIRYDLDGTLYIVPTLRKTIECICSADTVGLFSTNIRSGKKASLYVLGKDRIVTFLEHTGEGKYTIRLADSAPLKEIIPHEILTSQHCDMKEMMLFEEAEYVHKQIESFDHVDAETRIQKCVKNSDSTKIIAKILSGNCGYMSVQIHSKGKSLYNAIYNTLLIVVDNHTISLLSDENDVLCFEGLCPENVIDRISLHLELGTKRGAV